MLIEDQTQSITMSSKKILVLEDQNRSKDSELEEKEGALRRANESANESKKKLI